MDKKKTKTSSSSSSSTSTESSSSDDKEKKKEKKEEKKLKKEQRKLEKKERKRLMREERERRHQERRGRGEESETDDEAVLEERKREKEERKRYKQEKKEKKALKKQEKRKKKLEKKRRRLLRKDDSIIMSRKDADEMLAAVPGLKIEEVPDNDDTVKLPKKVVEKCKRWAQNVRHTVQEKEYMELMQASMAFDMNFDEPEDKPKDEVEFSRERTESSMSVRTPSTSDSSSDSDLLLSDNDEVLQKMRMGLGHNVAEALGAIVNPIQMAMYSKEVFGPVAAVASTYYPDWLAENKDRLEPAEYEKMLKAAELYKEINDLCELEIDEDDVLGKNDQTKKIQDLGQKLQLLNHQLPPELQEKFSQNVNISDYTTDIMANAFGAVFNTFTDGKLMGGLLKSIGEGADSSDDSDAEPDCKMQ